MQKPRNIVAEELHKYNRASVIPNKKREFKQKHVKRVFDELIGDDECS